MQRTNTEYHELAPRAAFEYGGRTYQKVDEQFAKVIQPNAESSEEKRHRFYPETIVSTASE